MPKVVIIPNRIRMNFCKDAASFANDQQDSFSFEVGNPDPFDEAFPIQREVDALDVLKFLDDLKRKNNYKEEDLFIAIYDGMLSCKSKGLSQLFAYGNGTEEQFPYTVVISINYKRRKILERDDQNGQSILYLILAALVSVYVRGAEPHAEKGDSCLMDQNLILKDINEKLGADYALCSDCYNKIRKEKYGNEIIAVLESFRGGYLRFGINNYRGHVVNKTVYNVKNGQINIGNNNNNIQNYPQNFKEIIPIINSLKEEISEKKDIQRKDEIISCLDNAKAVLLSDQQDKSQAKNFLESAYKFVQNIGNIADVADKISKIYNLFS